MLDLQRIEEKLRVIERELEEEYRKKTPTSKALYERATKVLPGGVTYHIRWFSPYPLYITRAQGARVWDADGNEYVDLWMGHGAHVLGHNPDIIRERVVEVLAERGAHLGYENELAVEYAELLVKVIPSAEKIRFANSGTEANMYTLRLARAYTKRKRIIKIKGGWHGGYDALLTGITPPYQGPESAGVPDEYTAYTTPIPFNDLEAAERELRKRDVAAVILEPVLGAGGCIEADPDYLRGLRELTQQYDTLLVFDEVITGFRLALGGAQEYYGVTPDITVLGKAVGGGYPGSGAIAGREDIMNLMDHTVHPSPRERVGQGGTFVGNPLTITAGYALVSHLYKNKSLYEEFNSLWSSVRERLQKTCNQAKVPCWATGTGNMVGLHFTSEKPRNHEDAVLKRWSEKIYTVLHLHLRLNGILYMTEHTVHFLPSMAHTSADADKVVEAIREFIESL